MWILDKLSSPEWTRKFSTKFLAEEELLKQLCPDCRKEPAPLRSSCGIEYKIYDENDGPNQHFIEISVDAIEKAIKDGGPDMTGDEFADRLLGKQ